MSRYDFPGIVPETSLAIGWDRPLQTFFVHVTTTGTVPDIPDDGEVNDDRTILWLGTKPRELPYAADAIRIAKPFAVLPKDLGQTLEVDRLRTAGDSDGPAQRDTRPFLSGSS